MVCASLHKPNKIRNRASGGIVQSNLAINYTYDGTVGGTTKGNLATRTDIGKYSTNGYHRITGAMGANYPFPYNDPPLAITAGPQNITYTSFHQPASISETVNGTPYLLEYTYDADQQRNYSKLRNMNSPILWRERLRSCLLYPLGSTSARAKDARASWGKAKDLKLALRARPRSGSAQGSSCLSSSPILWRERLRSCPLHPLGSTSARAKADCASWGLSGLIHAPGGAFTHCLEPRIHTDAHG